MGLAETFGEIFRDVFGTWPLKPRIKRQGRGWICVSSDGRKGYGVSPRMAYGGWLAARGEFMPEKYVKRGPQFVPQATSESR